MREESQPMCAPISSFTFMSRPPFSRSFFSSPYKNLAKRKELRLDKRLVHRVGRGFHPGSSLNLIEDIDNKTNPNAPPPQNNNRECEIISLEVKEVCECVKKALRCVADKITGSNFVKAIFLEFQVKLRSAGFSIGCCETH